MRLSADEVQGLDTLSRAFLDAFREAFPSLGYREVPTDRLVLTIPAEGANVSDLEVDLAGGEITVYHGVHTHCHYSLYLADDAPSREIAERRIAAYAVDHLPRVLADEVVVWSVVINGQQGSGATTIACIPKIYRRDLRPSSGPAPHPRAVLPNQRLKLSGRGGRLEGNGSVLIAAAAPRSLSAIR